MTTETTAPVVASNTTEQTTTKSAKAVRVVKTQPKAKAKPKAKPANLFPEIERGVTLVRALSPNTKNGKIAQRILTVCGIGKVPVTKLYQQLRLPQSVVSARLAVLRELKVVTVDRVGRQRLYSTNASKVAHIQKAIGALIA